MWLIMVHKPSEVYIYIHSKLLASERSLTPSSWSFNSITWQPATGCRIDGSLYCVEANCPFWSISGWVQLSLKEKRHLPYHPNSHIYWSASVPDTRPVCGPKKEGHGMSAGHVTHTTCGCVCALSLWILAGERWGRVRGKTHSRGQFGGNVKFVEYASVQQCVTPQSTEYTHTHTP